MTSEFYEQLGVDRAASASRIRSAYGGALSRLAKRRRALLEQGGDTVQLDLQQVRVEEAWGVLSDPLRRRRYDALLAMEDRCAASSDVVWAAVSDALVHPAAAVAGKLLRVTSGLAEIGLLPLAPSAGDEPPTLIPHDDDLTSPRVARLAPAPLEGGPHAEPLDGWPPRIADPSEVDGSLSSDVPGFSPDGYGGGRAVAEPDPSRPPAILRPSTIPAGEGWRPRADSEGYRTTLALPPLEVLPTIPSIPGVDVAGAPPPAALRVVDGSPGASDVFVMPRKEPPPPPPVRGLPPEELMGLVDQLGYSGHLLRAVRERVGLKLGDIADHTRISIRYLEALETEEREALPAPTFIRGYVREVGRLLEIDADALVAGYMRRFEE